MTAAGFEPLLKFAYTSKLHFGKDNVLEIRNSASVLGFRDLDEACFDFLLPKFFNSNASASFQRKTCCKKKCKRRLSRDDCGIDSDKGLSGDKEVKPVADSPSQQEVAQPCNKSANSNMGSQSSTNTVTPVPERKKNDFTQCPKYRKFQLACGKESCIMERRLHNTVAVIRDVCDLLCSPCSTSRNRNNDIDMEFPGKSNSTRPSKEAAEKHDRKPEESVEEERREACVVMKDDRGGKWNEKQRETEILRTGEEMEHATGFGSRACVEPGSVGSSVVQGARSVHPIAEDLKEAEGKGAEIELEDRVSRGEAGSVTRRAVLVNNARDKSDTEAAENLAKPMGFSLSWSQANYQDHDVGSSSDTGSERMQSASSERPKPSTLGSGGSRCPFYQDADPGRCFWKGAGLSECEGASQSGVSSLNSGEDGDSETETEGDSESYARERARQVRT